MSLAAETTSLITALEQLGPHDHFCSIYESPEEHYAVAIPFMRIGLERGEKCIYIADDGMVDEVRQAMESDGIDVEREIASNALVLSTKEQAYLEHGSFDPEWMFTFWKEATQLALSEGFSAVRATGETEWVLRGGRGLERWMEYESRLTHTLSENKCSALCQYNRSLFPPELILDVIRTHPMVVYRGTVCRNLYYVPPGEFLGTNQAAREVERVLTNIRERERVEKELREQLQERRRAEDALRRSESYLAEAQRLSHTGSWAFNEKGPLYWSEENVRIWGFDPQQGLPDRDVIVQRIHPEDRSRVLEYAQNVVRERKDYAVEFRIVLPDGAVRYIHGLGHTVLSAGGELVEVVGTNVDVTDRKRSEMLLGGEKQLLEMIARGDLRTYILDALCRLVEELAPSARSSILLFDPKTKQLRHGAAPSLPASYTEAIDGLAIGPSECSCGTAAYRVQPVIVSDIATDPLWANYRELALAEGLRACWSTPILSSGGRVLGTFAIYLPEPRSPNPQEQNLMEQITSLASIAVEREQAEDALQKTQAELAHATRVMTIGELVASIAHEVNQPLGAIVTNGHACVRLLSGEAPNLDKLREVVRRMIADGMRASEVIKRIRELLQKTPVEKVRLNINETVQEVIALVSSDLFRSNVELKTELEADLPPVSGDRIQLQQVILNLIINAKDAMSAPQTNPRLLVISSQKSETGDVVVAVRDSGTGLDTETFTRIFEPFFTTKHNGMGMGLAIGRTIIEAHGGRLWGSPNQPQGAVFQFTLPAKNESL
jgi:PAS domain S-box-containing protein